MNKSQGFDAKKFLSQNSIWVVLIGMVLIMNFLIYFRIHRWAFLTPMNIQTLFESESIRGILTFGVMFAILSKGIDLSTGSVAGMVAVIVASLVQPVDMETRLIVGGPQLPGAVAIIIGLLIGAVTGAIMGSIIAYTKIHPFIATLGGQLICRAVAKMYSNRPVSNLPDSFRAIAKAKIGPIPMIIVVFIIMFCIATFILTQTRFGKNVYAIGGSDQAARVAGINVERNLVMVYVWCSACAALGGILLAARTGSADSSTYGLNYELDAIAAATVGGTSQTGGICRPSGALAGILIMGVINNGLVLMGVDDNMTNVIKGLIIVGAVILDMRKNAKKS
ncbi:MAG: ABC transporter permease [Lachnospiraceae bacterium]|nr:ABC transporter permease [Lachnospiraceae bacterium]